MTGRGEGWCALPLVCFAVATACADNGSHASEAETSAQVADWVGLSVSTDVREEGALRARVFGDTVHTWEEEHRMVLFPLTVQLFDGEGAPTGRLTADKGQLNRLTRQMSAVGSVVLVSADGTRKILTEELQYDPAADRIWSEAPTTLIDGGVRLEGSGFEANADFTRVEVLQSTGERVQRSFQGGGP